MRLNLSCRAAVLSALGAAALLPAGASAATLVRSDPNTLVYTAAPGTAAHVLVHKTFDGAGVTINSGEADAVTALPDGCEGGTFHGANVVTCTGVTAVHADLGDGDDIGQVSDNAGVRVTLAGGAGNDLLEGADEADVFDGGPGDDRLVGGLGDDELRGGDGADVLEGRGGRDLVEGGAGDDTLHPDGFEAAAADVVDGGPGLDTVTQDYSSRFTDVQPPVAITLAGGADDGRPGEGDDLRGIERVVLGVGGTFTGGDGSDEFRLMQVGAASTLTGLGGDDRLRGGDGPDRLDGGPGADVLDGGFGDDVIVGGPGRDAISADLAGGDCGPLWCKQPFGNDRIEARDGEADSIACGAGTDVVIADPVDVVAPDCEDVQGGPAGGGGEQPRRGGGGGAVPRRGGSVPRTGGSATQPRGSGLAAGGRIALAGTRRLGPVLRDGLVVRLTGLRPGARSTVRALVGRRAIGTARVKADPRGGATARVRVTRAGRRALRGKRSVRVTLRAGAVTGAVTLKR